MTIPPIDLTTGLITGSFDDLIDYVQTLPLKEAKETLKILPKKRSSSMPQNPLNQAQLLDDSYVSRPHLEYLSSRIAQAIKDVENGKSRKIAVSMPPRVGKSFLTSTFTPVWILRKHPDWKLGLISHDPDLAATWGRAVRRMIEEHGSSLSLQIAKDAGAVSQWETTMKGGVTSRSAPGQSIVGRGFKVMLIDDVVKDFETAHNKKARDKIWNWWKANAVNRLEPPSLVVVVGTRWHEDDFIARLLSSDHEGDPAE